jgi:tyrosine-protein kinase Etk/Wzc
VRFFEEQLAQASETLDATDASLIEFETSNYTRIITAQLESLLQTQVDYLGDQRTVSYIAQDVQGLRDQHAAQPSDQAVSLADELTALLLQIKAFNVQTEAPIQFQIDSREALSKKSASEQVALLDDLLATLQAKSTEIDTRLERLQPQILALQQSLQEANVERDRLLRDQELARETYLTLARKLDEAHIAAEEENGSLLVGSYAAVPEEPVSPRKMLIVVLAGTLGLLAGVFAAFAFEFWQQRSTLDPDEAQ